MAMTEESPILKKSKHLVQKSGSIVGSQVAECILPDYPTFCSAIPTELKARPWLGSIDGRVPVSHHRAHTFITEEFGPALHKLGFGKGDRVALVLPNGSELALAIVATAHWAACVPLSANGAQSELEADLGRAGVDLVIGPYAGPTAPSTFPVEKDDRFHVMPKSDGGSENQWAVFSGIEETANRMKIPFIGLLPSPSESGIFQLVLPSSKDPVAYGTAGSALSKLSQLRAPKNSTYEEPSAAADEVLILFTSGTTGNKKLVPHQLGDMLTAATTIALSWALTPEDVNCNLMPLFHVGGIVRQIFSPLLSGGCVICCPSFDPSVFWALLEKNAFSWYYAAPTMHQLILQTGRENVDGSSSMTLEQKIKPSLRMIANAAGGLLPSLAVQLRETFTCNVLPSYGMTECMPISSPPPNYQLEKPGTSGVPVGPEVAILNLGTLERLPPGTEGPICVRGEPCFRGYGQIANDPSEKVEETFLPNGFFSTGDLGYLDEDGYLFITGRSKEVINRGGEIISPMEVEEEVGKHPDIASCAAFSTSHNVLQEVVGISIVMKADRPRLDLPSLHQHLSDLLAAPKWPQCLVFIDGLPKSHTNKLLRVKLGTRFGLPEMRDDMAPIERTFEAKCPPQGTGLDVPIPVTPIVADAEQVHRKLNLELDLNTNQQLLVVPHPNRVGALACYLVNVNRDDAINTAMSSLHRYEVPTHFVILEKRVVSKKGLPIPTTMDALASILQSSSDGPVDPVLQDVQAIFIELLDLDYNPAPESSFFHMGGSSMLASQLASKIRKRFQIPFSGSDVFQHSSCEDMAKLIRKHEKGSSASPDSTAEGADSLGKSVSDHGAPFASEHMAPKNTFISHVVQLIPMFIILPVWQVTRYLLFFAVLFRSIENVPRDRDIGTFLIAYVAFHLTWVIFMPLVFVLIKWILIGKYKAGRYPIRGSYYLRWWIVDICRKLFLRGIWGSNETLLNFYYRLLGAKIGRGARISLEADIAEYDLIEIGRNAAIEHSTMRPFGVDNGAMILGPVKVGIDASVGARSVVAPYTSIPKNCHLGAVTSSYEVGQALDIKHARVNRRCIPEPNMFMQLVVGTPITLFVNLISQIPPLMVLLWMLAYKGDRDSFHTVGDLMAWLCDPKRIIYFIGIRVSRAVLSPFFYMAAGVIVKRVIIGKFEAGSSVNLSQWQLMRHWLAATLFSRKKIQEVADIVGRHYEVVSTIYRLLGAKVGKRVFWPGQQPVFSGEFDLLEIGDDCVFGSRSSIFFSTIDSCQKVVLCAGANVADNCVVFPGSIIGKNAVLGSNSVCPENWYLAEGSVWFGSKGGEPNCLERGVEKFTIPVLSSYIKEDQIQLTGDMSTLRPFGKAFYMRKASYFVWPLEFIMCASFTIKVLISTFHTLPLLASLHGAAAMLYGFSLETRDYDIDKFGFIVNYLEVYGHVVWVMLFAHAARVAIWLAIELTAKWTLMGRRQPGRYNYDTTSYAQRWEMYQMISKVRKFHRLSFLDFLSGTPFMTAYFRWNGGNVGKDCCLYPAGADPFMPEPELVTIGDRSVVDCASIVCHLNTRGNFELQKIRIEENCTLRTRSRLQQGCVMEKGSQLLEKSLAMTGEIIESKSVWQGGPAAWWFQYSDTTIDYAQCPE